MNQEQKDACLRTASIHVDSVRAKLDTAIQEVKDLIGLKVGAAKLEDKWVNERVKALGLDRLDQLNKLKNSPYFSECECDFEGVNKKYYFGKFTFPEASIYSWVSPIASIRFDAIGPTTYKLPSGIDRNGVLKNKSDYVITDGKIVFYTTESKDFPKTLIYQEHFSKGGKQNRHAFMLPEIVSQMEKAQDKIIRASHKNPIVISGPAGSGKTTLALHRIAYLLQSPLTVDTFKYTNIIVFVQDELSQEYFSHLLPELGINTVSIRTFLGWSKEILGINEKNIKTVGSYSASLSSLSPIPSVSSSSSLNDAQIYIYEQEKIRAMRKALTEPVIFKFSKSIFSLLTRVYKDQLSEESDKIFIKQKSENTLDRIDITVLLCIFNQSHKPGQKKKISNNYSLIVIDEFQNYLPEQHKIFKSYINEDTKSIIYVGDIAQQINPSALRSFEEINESVPEERYILLNKVYRNTKQILDYISSLDYSVQIPEGIKSGDPVDEKSFNNYQEMSSYILEQIKDISAQGNDNPTIGILTVDTCIPESIKNLKLGPDNNVHIMTIRESQGLEFDIVFLAGFNKESYFDLYKNKYLPTELVKEKEKIDKDLLYIGLTRAIKKLHVLSLKQGVI